MPVARALPCISPTITTLSPASSSFSISIWTLSIDGKDVVERVRTAERAGTQGVCNRRIRCHRPCRPGRAFPQTKRRRSPGPSQRSPATSPAQYLASAQEQEQEQEQAKLAIRRLAATDVEWAVRGSNTRPPACKARLRRMSHGRKIRSGEPDAAYRTRRRGPYGLRPRCIRGSSISIRLTAAIESFNASARQSCSTIRLTIFRIAPPTSPRSIRSQLLVVYTTAATARRIRHARIRYVQRAVRELRTGPPLL